MNILPAHFVFEKLIGVNLLPFLEKHTGISQRTYRNWRQGTKPKPGTIVKICEKINSILNDNNPNCQEDFRDIWDNIFKSDCIFGWEPLLDSFNAGSYPHVLFPNTQNLIKEFESNSIKFFEIYKAKGLESAVQYLISLDLNPYILIDENLNFIKRSTNIQSLSKILFLISLENLLCLIASLDVELNIMLEKKVPIRSKFSQFLPVREGESTLLPIARFFNWIQAEKGFKNKAKMFEFIDDVFATKEKENENDPDPPSIQRRLSRWMKDKGTRWSRLDRITKYLFPEYDDFERRISLAPIFLFRNIYKCLKDGIRNQIYIGTEEDILEIFAQYENWFDQLSKKYLTI